MKRDYSDFVPPPRFQPCQKLVRQVAAPSQSELIQKAVEVLKSCKRNSAKVDQLCLLFGVRMRRGKKATPSSL